MSKIILSRKGYDDQYGGKPSVILPDGTMLSFPIPLENENGINSDELSFRNKTLSTYFEELGHNITNLIHHVDPDIYDLTGKMPKGTFGQAGAALSHLENEGIKKGDIFLFFGTFCNTHADFDKLKYENMHPFHAIYGYLIVDEIIKINKLDETLELKWLETHPHFSNRTIGDYAKNNVVYLGSDYGYFKFSPTLQLTKPGYLKSYWQLPKEFEGVSMTYHKVARQRLFSDHIEFSSVAKGQEFVFDLQPKLQGWLDSVVRNKINPD